MRLKYHVSDLEKIAKREEIEFKVWLIAHPEYETTDGVIYYECFKKAV